ncbi:MAG: hypothetical protein LBQ88_22800 [Treponema sp.]|nr:hypothetical protein [Treponema sp.]
MRRVLTVLLLFTSFTIFAQKQEIGRFYVEFRDYDKIFEVPESRRNPNIIYKEFEIHITSTLPESYAEMQDYLNRFRSGIGGTVQVFPNKRIITTNYRLTEEGRWRPLFVFFPLYTGQGLGSANSKGYNELDAFDVAIYVIVREMNKNYPGTFTYDHIFDLNEEEYYWILNKHRKDENGIAHYSFKAEFIIYRE